MCTASIPRKAFIVFIITSFITNVSPASVGREVRLHDEFYEFYPCEDSTKIVETFIKSNPPKYNITFLLENKIVDSDDWTPRRFNLLVKLDLPAKIQSNVRWLHFFDDEKSFQGGTVLEEPTNVTLVISPKRGVKLPNVISAKINSVVVCDKFYKDVWDAYTDLVEETTTTATTEVTTVNVINVCGNKKIQAEGFITRGIKSKPGDWPWHVALYRLEKQNQKYICGATLLSSSTVVTAAHCVIEWGSIIIPDRLLAVFGKYNFVGNNVHVQEKKVFKIFVHSHFSPATLDNDIAVLKLSSEVEFNDFVQPICLWETLTITDKFGFVVGWGATENETHPEQLMESKLPFVTDLICLKSHLFFYNKLQVDGSYCAGFGNGTNVCNGDSGSGMYISRNEGSDKEVWYIKGIVSLGIPKINEGKCNPRHYSLFTDVSYYLDFVKNHL